MRIHWAHHTPTSKANPVYRGGGQTVGWRVTTVGGPWEPFDTRPQDSGTIPLIWSEPSDPKVLAPIVEEWLGRDTTPGIYDDAVIVYRWEGGKIRVAMARVNLDQNEEYPLYPKCFPEELPTWFRTGLTTTRCSLVAMESDLKPTGTAFPERARIRTLLDQIRRLATEFKLEQFRYSRDSDRWGFGPDWVRLPCTSTGSRDWAAVCFDSDGTNKRTSCDISGHNGDSYNTLTDTLPDAEALQAVEAGFTQFKRWAIENAIAAKAQAIKDAERQDAERMVDTFLATPEHEL